MSFNNNIGTYYVPFNNNNDDNNDDNSDEYVQDTDFITDNVRTEITNLINMQLLVHICLKVQIVVFGLFMRPCRDDLVGTSRDDHTTTAQPSCVHKAFHSKYHVIDRTTDLIVWLRNVFRGLGCQIDDFVHFGSGWTLVHLTNAIVNFAKYNPLRGGYWTKLPEQLLRKRACTNVKPPIDDPNNNECFKRAVLSALHMHEVSRPNHASVYYRFEANYNFTGISWPTSLHDITIFERNNPNISVNVFLWDRSSCRANGPLRVTKRRKSKHINLLLLEDPNNPYRGYHYVTINSLSRLISAQWNDHQHAIHVCETCLSVFQSMAALENHVKHYCGRVKVNCPSGQVRTTRTGHAYHDDVMKFSDYSGTDFHPVAIYFDSETYVDSSNNQHRPYAFAYYIHNFYSPQQSKFKQFFPNNPADTSESIVDRFVHALLDDVTYLFRTVLNVTIPLLQPITEEEERHFRECTACHLCGRAFEVSGPLGKARDHNHYNGAFRACLHNQCNVNRKRARFIPIFAHNGKNFDFHLIIKKLASFKFGSLTCLPVTSEKYTTFSFHFRADNTICTNTRDDAVMECRFLDSYSFMSDSLEKLTSYQDVNDLHVTRQFFHPQQLFVMFRKKISFPYDAITSIASLWNKTQFPAIEQFPENTTVEEYDNSRCIWTFLKCRNLLDFAKAYLCADVSHLTDVFQSFRMLSMKIYGLDPCFFFTGPSFAMKCLLYYTKQEIALFTDHEMVRMISKNIRGGLTSAVHRYAKANNKYMGDDYDPNEPSSYIHVFDFNALYSYAMSKKMPTGDYRWETNPHEFNVNEYDPETSSRGFVIECDLHYPKELHDAHNFLPFCPQHKSTPGSKPTKLICDFAPIREKYVIHIEMLQLALKHGLKLLRIHRVLSFAHAAWMKPFIDLNIELRKKAKNAFHKSSYKATNNYLFGRSLMNVEKRPDIKLPIRWESVGRSRGLEYYMSSPLVQNVYIFDESFAAVSMKKAEITYNNPMLLGFCILELSKVHFYREYYEFVVPYCRRKGWDHKLCLYDTDSYFLWVQCPDSFEMIRENPNKFDTSNFGGGGGGCSADGQSADNRFGVIPRNCGIAGLLKDEYAGSLVRELIALRSKLYCVVLHDGAEVRKAKGVGREILRKHVTSHHYKSCLDGPQNGSVEYSFSQRQFRSILHDVYTVEVYKKSITSTDTKRYICKDDEDMYSTLAWHHYAIPPEAYSTDDHDYDDDDGDDEEVLAQQENDEADDE